jgi:hypothetical protein
MGLGHNLFLEFSRLYKIDKFSQQSICAFLAVDFELPASGRWRALRRGQTGDIPGGAESLIV